jgi:hypothetical protein
LLQILEIFQIIQDLHPEQMLVTLSPFSMIVQLTEKHKVFEALSIHHYFSPAVTSTPSTALSCDAMFL